MSARNPAGSLLELDFLGRYLSIREALIAFQHFSFH